MRISHISILAGLLTLCLAEKKDRKERSEGGYYYGRGTPGGWDSRNGVQSFGWDSRRPTNPCTRCSSHTSPDNYRGNGYDNLSPEWQQKDMKQPWRPEYDDKRVWSGTIRPIENPANWDQRYDDRGWQQRWDSGSRPGGVVTNWMGGPSRWETYQKRDPWDKGYQGGYQGQGGRGYPSYYGPSNALPSHGSGYAGSYGYSDDRYSGRGWTKPSGYDYKSPVYYDRSRGESGYINRYDYNYQPWEETMRWSSAGPGWGTKNYASTWDYYEQRPGQTYGHGYHYNQPTSMSFTPLDPPYPDPWTERGPQRPATGSWTRPSYDRPQQGYSPGGYERPGYERPSYDRPYEKPGYKPGYEQGGWYENRPETRPGEWSRPGDRYPDNYRPDYRPDEGYGSGGGYGSVGGHGSGGGYGSIGGHGSGGGYGSEGGHGPGGYGSGGHGSGGHGSGGYRPGDYRPEYRPEYRPDGYRPDGYRPNTDGYAPVGHGYPFDRPVSRPGTGGYGSDSSGGDHKLDRYPGHTGVGATYDFYGNREHGGGGNYHYDRPTTSSTPTTTDRSTSGISSTPSSTTS